MPARVSNSDLSPPRGRLLVGSGVLIFGWLCPLFVPLVLASALPGEWKTVLSGLLLLGIPEVFTLAAVAILGKAGFEYLKGLLFGLLRTLAPPAAVGAARYRVGLVMFVLPLLFAWISAYVPEHIPGFVDNSIAFALGGDVMLLASLLVLGGDFWDKFRALFVNGAKARFAQDDG